MATEEIGKEQTKSSEMQGFHPMGKHGSPGLESHDLSMFRLATDIWIESQFKIIPRFPKIHPLKSPILINLHQSSIIFHPASPKNPWWPQPIDNPTPQRPIPPIPRHGFPGTHWCGAGSPARSRSPERSWEGLPGRSRLPEIGSATASDGSADRISPRNREVLEGLETWLGPLGWEKVGKPQVNFFW